MSTPSEQPIPATQDPPPSSDNESDPDSNDDALIFFDRTAETEQVVSDFWDDFEGRPRKRGEGRKAKASIREEDDLELPGGGNRALKRSFGFHYDYLEAILGLLSWLLVVTFLYQSSSYFGYTYHHLMYEVSHLLALTFAVPMAIVLGLYYWEVKKDGEEMLEVARFKNQVKRSMIRHKTKKGKTKAEKES